MSYRSPPRVLQHWGPFAESPVMKSSSRADILTLLALATHYLAIPVEKEPSAPEPLGGSSANNLAWALYRLRLQTYEAQTALMRLRSMRYVKSASSEHVDARSLSEVSDKLQGRTFDPSATEEYNQDKGRHQAESIESDTKTSDITSENRDVHASSLFRTGDDATRETAATPSPSSPTTTLAVAEKNSQTPHPASVTPARDAEASERGETNIGPLKTAKGQTMERTAGAAERRIDVPAPLEGTKESSDEKTALPSSRSAPSDHGPPAVASTTVTVGSEPDDTRQESSNQPLKGENKVPPPGTASRLPVPPHLPSSSDQRSSSLVTAASSTKEIPPIVQNSPGAIENGGGLPQQITSPLSNSVDKPRTSTSTATSAVAAATTIIAMAAERKAWQSFGPAAFNRPKCAARSSFHSP
ncbi:hypothetical protein FRB96_004355 [Tulasnella sp. 330]|nr:hypothetical protein FRB96_004355 [Tulasnella sp. 330]